MISKKIGIVTKIINEYEDNQELKVKINEDEENAINYVVLAGKVCVGDEVLLNTTAVELSLGTGGAHFVIANLSNCESNLTPGGHIMKLRYTPLQIKTFSVEEQDSIYHEKIENFKSLEKMPVVVAGLHSMLAPFACAIKRKSPHKKIAYIMTDGASLPIALSKSVKELKSKKLIDATITVGNAFGGDYECVNVYTALIAAKEIVGADITFVSMGPGIVGTGTKYGFTGIEQGYILDAVHKLGGKPIGIPRISFADKRDRHKGISHHYITTLKEIVNVRVNIPINIQDKQKRDFVKKQILENEMDKMHNIIYIENDTTQEDLEYYGVSVRTMGRKYEDDQEFFKSCSGAAYYILEE